MPAKHKIAALELYYLFASVRLHMFVILQKQNGATKKKQQNTGSKQKRLR